MDLEIKTHANYQVVYLLSALYISRFVALIGTSKLVPVFAPRSVVALMSNANFVYV
jgi:hypothetical protein